MTRTLQKSRDGGPISSGAPPSQDPEFYPAGAPGGLCCEPHLHSKRLDFTQPFAPFVMCWVSRMVLALGDVFIIFISVGDHQRDLKKKISWAWNLPERLDLLRLHLLLVIVKIHIGLTIVTTLGAALGH